MNQNDYENLKEMYSRKPYKEIREIARNTDEGYTEAAQIVAKDMLAEKESEYKQMEELFKDKSLEELKEIAINKKGDYTEIAQVVAEDILERENEDFDDVVEERDDTVEHVKQVVKMVAEGDVDEPTRKSSIVIGIAVIIMTLCIIASLVSFYVASKARNDVIESVYIIIGVLNIIQGLILFAIMYGIGHILKNSEEINDTNKEISEKMDDLIRILKVKENE